MVHRQRDESEPLPLGDERIGVLEPEPVRSIGQEDDRTSIRAKDGLLYDVINRKGEIEYRVQFPKDYALAGFGENGVVYVVHLSGRRGTLQRTTVK